MIGVVRVTKSLLEPGWSPVPDSNRPASDDSGYGITLVDFAAELFGLSTLWLGPDFFVNNTDHWPQAALEGVPIEAMK
eukprot:COSAG01_NODE_1116_length_11642_cov_7.561899_7_plen_78_part_00